VDPGDELVDIVDEDDRLVRVVTRRQMRAERLLHRGTAILVRRDDDDVLVHRRTDTKDVHAGMHDMFFGGVVCAGETYEDNARRELAEEAGIEGVEPRFLYRYLYRGPTVALWTAAYEVRWDGDVRLQPEEVAWGAFVTVAELGRMLVDVEFGPDSRDLYARLRAEGLI
jgi:8-oxo-dGTP pyrophosphatase MutT (NUDIX family)